MQAFVTGGLKQLHNGALPHLTQPTLWHRLDKRSYTQLQATSYRAGTSSYVMLHCCKAIMQALLHQPGQSSSQMLQDAMQALSYRVGYGSCTTLTAQLLMVCQSL